MNPAQGADEAIQAGELIVRPGQYTASARGHVLTLSVKEFELLVVLARNPGRIIRRDELYRTVWAGELEKGDRSVDVYVHKLRSKLEAVLPEWVFIHTHHGWGYRWYAERSQLVSNLATGP